eukprot:s2093_g9.t3
MASTSPTAEMEAALRCWGGFKAVNLLLRDPENADLWKEDRRSFFGTKKDVELVMCKLEDGKWAISRGGSTASCCSTARGSIWQCHSRPCSAAWRPFQRVEGETQKCRGMKVTRCLRATAFGDFTSSSVWWDLELADEVTWRNGLEHGGNCNFQRSERTRNPDLCGCADSESGSIQELQLENISLADSKFDDLEDLDDQLSREAGADLPMTSSGTARASRVISKLSPELVQRLRINQQIGRASPAKILSLCEDHLEVLDAVNVATALHRVAKASKSNGMQLPSFGQHSVGTGRVAGFKRADHGSDTWLYQNCQGFHLFTRIGRNVSTDVKPRDLASLVWSFTSLSVQHPSLRRTLREYGIGRSAQFSAIDLASIAWSLALLQWHGDQMMEEIALAAGQQVSRLPVQALSNLVWCLERCIEEFKSQDLANSAWSFAALAVHNAFMTAVASAALKRLKNFGSTAFTPQGISNII